jgi:hypothetical protein
MVVVVVLLPRLPSSVRIWVAVLVELVMHFVTMLLMALTILWL